MTEEVDSRILGLDPSDTNKANDLNSFILGDTDDWSLDQTEVNTNISNLLPFPEEGKDIQKAHRDEIQESKSEITGFWWDSMGPTELGSRDEKESPENCEDYIDFMYVCLEPPH